MDWQEPVTDRKSERTQTTCDDFNRICNNINLIEGTTLSPLRVDYTEDDIVEEYFWVTLVEKCQRYDSSITYSADYINLNKIEQVAKDNYSKTHVVPSASLYPAEDLYPQ